MATPQQVFGVAWVINLLLALGAGALLLLALAGSLTDRTDLLLCALLVRLCKPALPTDEQRWHEGAP